MFDILPFDVQEMLLRYIESPRDFLNVALSCRRWAEACQRVRFPLRHAELYHSEWTGETRITFDSVGFQEGRSAHVFVQFDDRNIREIVSFPSGQYYYQTYYWIEPIFAKIMAVERFLGILNQFRCSFPESLEMSIIYLQELRIRCNIADIAGTAQQLRECKGKLKLERFMWSSELYEAKFSSIQCYNSPVENSGITQDIIEKWKADWQNGITYSWTKAEIYSVRLSRDDVEQLEQYPGSYNRIGLDIERQRMFT